MFISKQINKTMKQKIYLKFKKRKISYLKKHKIKMVKKVKKVKQLKPMMLKKLQKDLNFHYPLYQKH